MSRALDCEPLLEVAKAAVEDKTNLDSVREQALVVHTNRMQALSKWVKAIEADEPMSLGALLASLDDTIAPARPSKATHARASLHTRTHAHTDGGCRVLPAVHPERRDGAAERLRARVRLETRHTLRPGASGHRAITTWAITI